MGVGLGVGVGGGVGVGVGVGVGWMEAWAWASVVARGSAEVEQVWELMLGWVGESA